jgi:RNA polymerase sigma-70 factor (ECF subfamily)
MVDDLAQDTFVKVIRALGRFDRQGPARLSTWILTIATRTCLDELRRRAQPEPLPDELPGVLDPEDRVAQNQLAQRVTRVIGELSPEHRAVLVLRAYHDLDYDEIALALAIETGTVKSRLSRAREVLRRALAGEAHG